MSRNPRRILVLAVAVLAGTGLLAATAPSLLSLRPLRPVAAWFVSQTLGLPVTFRTAAFTWRGPQTFAAVAVAQPPGFGGTPLLTAERLVLESGPGGTRSVRASDGSFVVLLDPGGTSNLVALPERVLRGVDAHARVELELERIAIEVSDRATGSTQHLFVRDGSLAIERGRVTRVRLSGESAGPGGGGPLTLAYGGPDAAEDAIAPGARRPADLLLTCAGLDLHALEPLLRALGVCDGAGGSLDFDGALLRGPGGAFTLRGTGTARGLRLEGGMLGAGGLISDTVMSMSGSLTLDPSLAHLECEAFSFRSSWLGIDANGAARAGPQRIEGDLKAAISANLDFLMRRAPSMVDVLPIAGGAGGLDATIEPDPAGGFAFTGGTRGLSVAIPPRRRIGLDEAECRGRIDVASTLDRVDLHDVELRTIKATARGGGTFARPREDAPFVLRSATLSLDAEFERIVDVIVGWIDFSPITGAGEFSAQATYTREGVGHALDLTIRAEDLDLYLTPMRDFRTIDNYFFRGRPMTAHGHLEIPDVSAASSWRGSLRVDAPGAVIRDDTFENFALAATLADGAVRFDRFEGDAHGGHVRAAGSVAFGGRDDALLDVSLEGEDLAIEGHAAELSAQVVPLFAAPRGPWQVKGTPRLSGSLGVEANGIGLLSFSDSARGTGSFRWTAGTLDGSPLLDRLAPAEPGTTARRIDGITAQTRFEGGRQISAASLRLPDRPAIRIEGWADWRGHLDYEIPPEDLFDAALLARHGDALKTIRFGVFGSVNAPEIRVPDLAAWKRLDAEGALGPAIEEFARAGAP